MSEDEKLKKIVDQIWVDYDTDNNGTLDKEECKTFV